MELASEVKFGIFYLTNVICFLKKRVFIVQTIRGVCFFSPIAYFSIGEEGEGGHGRVAGLEDRGLPSPHSPVEVLAL